MRWKVISPSSICHQKEAFWRLRPRYFAASSLHEFLPYEASPLAIHYTNTGSAVIIEALVRGRTKWMIAVAITYTLAQAKNTTV
jgi:hypothetical protein